MAQRQVLQADWTWNGRSLEPDVRVTIGAEGVIEKVDTFEPPTRRLRGYALLPGMINVHSHAFQRGLRGKTETFSSGAGSFWSWRDEMYKLVSSITEDHLYQLSLQAFQEMLRTGITTVGEFHYLHHANDTGIGYALDEVVLQAASDAGIRIVLLNAFFRTGGIGKPLAGSQLRFRSSSLEAYWKQMDRLNGTLASSKQSLGCVAHSIRAASTEDIKALVNEARSRSMVFHIHVEEQLQEIEECCNAYGAPPMRILNDQVQIGSDFTAVHCTHTGKADMRLFGEQGGNVCICPLTEANLGDGVADLPGIVDAGVCLSVGTDSNSRLCMFEELRWLEYVQRLSRQRRGVLIGKEGRVASELLKVATVNGARSLGLPAGRIQAGQLADFVCIDINDVSLKGCRLDSLPDAVVFGAGIGAVAATCVGGRWAFERERDG